MSVRAMNWLQTNLGLDVTGEWSQQISLNVGGVVFVTRRATFESHKDNPFFRQILDGSAKRCDDGCFFIDRDGVVFRHILNFLRSKNLIVPEGFDEWEQLLDDARFFQLADLEDAVLSRFEYQRSVFRRALPQAVFAHWENATNDRSSRRVSIVPQLPALTVREDGAEVRYRDELLQSIDELVTTLLSSYGYIVQHWNEREGKVFLTLGPT